jgi:exonuclease III
MPRGYGGVTIIWRENIDHLIKILTDGAERIQCEEINSNNDTKFLVASVYLPSKESHEYVDEFYDCIDQLYEIYQRYQGKTGLYLSTPFPTKFMFLFKSPIVLI